MFCRIVDDLQRLDTAKRDSTDQPDVLEPVDVVARGVSAANAMNRGHGQWHAQ
jgi:hypothetical protein